MASIQDFFHRIGVANRLRSASLFMEDKDLHRLPVVYGNNKYFLTKDALWSGFSIPPKDAGFLSRSVQQSYFTEDNNWFTTFPSGEENSGQILIVNHVQTASEWEEALIKKESSLAKEEGRALPGAFEKYVNLSRRAIDAQQFFKREVFLFTRISDRQGISGIRSVLEQTGRQLTSGFGLDDSQPLEEEKRISAEKADQIETKMASSSLHARRLNRSKVEWIIRYLDSLGCPTPDVAPSDIQEWGIGKWQSSMSAWTHEVDLGKDARNKRIRAIEFITTTGEGKSYACFLPVVNIPGQMAPLSNWLFQSSTLPFPVDVSLRFEVIDPIRAERELDRPIDAAKAQAMEEREADRELDETTLLQRQALESVKQTAIMQQKPLIYWQCVFCVYSDDPEDLKERCTKLRTHYDSLQMQLDVPPNDQRALFYQSFPGSELIVKDWIQRTNSNYIASSQPWLDITVGAPQEKPALYQGFTIVAGANTAKPSGPVFFDLVSVADEEGRAPTEFVCGDPGSGKTVSRGLKTAHENALKGITQYIWDPKGDFVPLHDEALKLLIDPTKIDLITLGDRKNSSISLDGFAIAEYDEALEIDDRNTTVKDILTNLTAELKDSSVGIYLDEVISHLIKQVMDDAKRNGTNPKMLDIFPILEEIQIGEIRGANLSPKKEEAYQDTARNMLLVLEDIRRNSLGKLFFTDPDRGSLQVKAGNTVIFNAINLPEVDPDFTGPESRNVIISKVVQQMMTSYIRSLVTKLPDTVTKAIYFDEWHVIRRSPAAERLLDWLKRMGRSKRTSVIYLSQSAKDSGGGTLNSIWCGKCETEDNARASCELLQIEKNQYNVNVLMALQAGEFLFRDPYGHVARVVVDFWDQDVLDTFNTQAKAKAAKEARKRELEEQERAGLDEEIDLSSL